MIPIEQMSNKTLKNLKRIRWGKSVTLCRACRTGTVYSCSSYFFPASGNVGASVGVRKG